ncbi:MAG: ATP-binding protein [Chryseobacterium sp.]|uniref:ABC transporter ATP-binding protein n=1 Tax=unclassified Chryseobacterium TaxID=2593645 RepID=UPI000DB5677A|nr:MULTISPECIES: ABC transporter ATP-binding protein [unclassified Chryseobacterium]MPS63631.1 ABC transporter ATP-binding protein [Chryseobacterium sp.]PZU12835.1 MAG: ATP-binding protein [Chryseobacterium sp.]UMQ40900.1 ABC transporter ATP-binding protein [Chryseobacterium sp. Y16C]
MITINNLSKTYGKATVLNIESLEIPNGETFGLVGNNGAGKTTLFSLMLDLIQATTGFVSIDGIKVNESEAWKNKVSAFVDDSFLIGYLTPEEYFYFIGELRGQNKASVDEFLKQFHDLFNGEILNSGKYVRDLSKGNQKKVGIVGAIIGNPEIIILDEPFANLDPSTQIKLKNLIKELSKQDGVTFLISSHDLSHTTEVCNRIVVVNKGQLVKDIQTNPETLKDLEQYFADQVSKPAEEII